jgi:6-phosphofructokinase 1
MRSIWLEKRSFSPHGGIGQSLAKYINDNSDLDARDLSLSYLQRSGIASSYDSFLAMEFGAYGAKLFKDGKFGEMVAMKNNELSSISIKDAVSELKLVDPKSQIMELAYEDGFYFGE